MNVTSADKGDYTVININGNIEMTTMKSLKEMLLEIAASSDKNIAIDFSKVEYLDSSGLGVLLTISKVLKGRGKKIKLINIPDKIAMVMQLSSVKTLIED
ncbi:MAG TPA: STAS domain-containing protein [Spirochaetota bacterium]|nr:STAS domain-containing protein [Spirochaetota bacterium]HPI88401.1 STAS domain-containing protein [Spirochaetota bacterium]HPR46741.1 STAS domain-containing protein [Spirochaetota bacterium]